jgi:hypothetical protein
MCSNVDGGCSGTGNLKTPEAIGHWVRAETCMYGGIHGAGDIYMEGYMQRLDDPSIRTTWGPYDQGEFTTDGFFKGDQHIWQISGGDTDPNFQQVVSLGMAACWDDPRSGLTEGGPWIGAAYEVEGGMPTSIPLLPLWGTLLLIGAVLFAGSRLLRRGGGGPASP